MEVSPEVKHRKFFPRGKMFNENSHLKLQILDIILQIKVSLQICGSLETESDKFISKDLMYISLISNFFFDMRRS